ncbi:MULTISPECIES: histidine phosphatase family protein [unclassified Uliginosibacterium]|uniref:SixA phosphatase family protein n=1 Tax=unclassified Uliginosibacterium TaxID=2621521 RepID=UPI000C7C192F|nr:MULTISPECIES: histidine phosphatase family protein [unclassified Uliginosibacterium]MDO6384909.1 histidine phosphatase family protein [Uliginosibacterium sp. 31-12]PLK48605.1 histidine phosphatase family protein [Uliginosibacterium sp. TH139]
MDLLLWRHADAGEGSPDISRTLTPRGLKQSQRMARWLDEHAPAELRVLVSPATRTRQTIEAWRSDYEINPAVGLDATPQSLLEAAGWPEAGGAVLVVGHQPTLGQVASLLLRDEDSALSFKKGALWWFQLRERNGELQTVLKTVINADLI